MKSITKEDILRILSSNEEAFYMDAEFGIKQEKYDAVAEQILELCDSGWIPITEFKYNIGEFEIKLATGEVLKAEYFSGWHPIDKEYTEAVNITHFRSIQS